MHMYIGKPLLKVRIYSVDKISLDLLFQEGGKSDFRRKSEKSTLYFSMLPKYNIIEGGSTIIFVLKIVTATNMH